MGNNPDCPKARWICITICSQGGEGRQCEYLKIKNTGKQEGSPLPVLTSKARILGYNYVIDYLIAKSIFDESDVKVDAVDLELWHDEPRPRGSGTALGLKYHAIM
jgi:hypothetical protein